METLLLTFAFMLLLTAAMAIGVLLGRKPISGSCGGMKALGMDVECEVCHGDPDVCRQEGPLLRRLRARLGKGSETAEVPDVTGNKTDENFQDRARALSSPAESPPAKD